MSNPIGRIRALETVRNWNLAFRPGQTVILDGQPHKTETPAALGYRDHPAVFLVGIEEPVDLDRLTVPGFKVIVGKQRKQSKPPKAKGAKQE